MPGKPDKQHRIRVRTLDGKPRDQAAINKLKSNQLGMPHLDIVGTAVANEFIICASKDTHIEQVKAKIAAAGLEPIDGGDTTIVATAGAPRPAAAQPPRQGGFQQHRGRPQQRAGGQQRPQQRRPEGRANSAKPLPGKPYGFIALPTKLTTAAPIWHDGTSSTGRLSGEIRFELETLTPLLVGWERLKLNESEEAWAIPFGRVSRNECAAVVRGVARATYPDATDADEQKRQRKQQKVEDDRRKYIERVQDHIVDVQVQNAGWSIDSKSVLCPLRAPWGKRPVIIPGDSLKGLLRHELGALLGAPMERVAERSYSYRPNAMYPIKPENRCLVPRLARVLKDHVETKPLDSEHQARVPTRLELFPAEFEYNKKTNRFDYRFDQRGGAPYRGGQGAGQKLNSKPNVHASLTVLREAQAEAVGVPKAARDGFLATVRHLVELNHGHFSERHPDVPNTVTGDAARTRILKAAKDEVFQPGDLVWVEWDAEKGCIVSLGWHYYYRWAYADSVRKDADAPRLERYGLFPLDAEREKDSGGAPKGLSAVRRLFGYTGDNEGSAGVGEKDHAQLMGRVFVNAGLEVVGANDNDDDRFLKRVFLKELGMPRPSAVEHYLEQPDYPNPKDRPDRAELLTYGDAAGYDAPGELAGRKFYLDRPNAQAEEDCDTNKQNDRSTLALEASKPQRKFRFTVRFRDVDAAELAAIVVALSPHQFKSVLGATHTDGYCSKLGYARPLGWGSVRIEAKALLLIDDAGDAPTLKPEADLNAWVKTNHRKTATQDEWLAIHRRNHPNADDYPRDRDRDGNENIYTFHTGLRAKHSRNRRYKNGRSP